MTFLSLGLCWSFATSYLDPKAPTKALLSMDGCQVIVAVGGIWVGDLLFCHLAVKFFKQISRQSLTHDLILKRIHVKPR